VLTLKAAGLVGIDAGEVVSAPARAAGRRAHITVTRDVRFVMKGDSGRPHAYQP
jgi:hypothetical protein